jgi:hypothetical protein
MTAEVQAALQAFMKPGQKALMVYKVCFRMSFFS